MTDNEKKAETGQHYFKIKYPPRKIKINWVEHDKLQPLMDHGVDFWYAKQGDHLDSQTQLVVAVLKEFRWLHNPGQKSVTVKILPKRSRSFRLSKAPAAEILKATRIALKKFFEEGPRNGQVTEVIRAWWNC